ncbi:amidotransferase 1, exosortase A system-associated [Thermostilla marina]
MCGIAGIVFRQSQHPVNEASLRAAAERLRHRGPDAQGTWSREGTGVAHCRLSIIDISAEADQPMVSPDGRFVLVYNGEIYNYRDLRPGLEKSGWRFRTQSDTEVLLAALVRWGEAAVLRLRGMFAFAFWDTATQRLILARDPVGQKPLYYAFDADRLVFASELKAIPALTPLDRTIDPFAVVDYMTFGCIVGERSVFRDVRKLHAGTTLVVDRNTWRPRAERYWRWEPRPNRHLNLDDWAEDVRDEIDEAVQAHRIADVPVGAFLSGGIDSSVIVAAASRHDPIETFSVGFREAEFSELPYARLTAETFHCPHHEEILTADLDTLLERFVYHYDEPFADSSALPSMLVCRAARRHVKAALSGDGGDEAFGGYRRYAHDLWEGRVRSLLPAAFRRGVLSPLSKVWPKADRLPRPLRLKTFLENLARDPAEAYANTISWCRPGLRRRLLHSDFLRSVGDYRPEECVIAEFRRGYEAAGGDLLAGMTAADIAILLPDDFLTKVDRASMAASLEVRPPLVDVYVMNFAGLIPSHFKVNRETKFILKYAFRDVLPKDILYRRKQGFEIPVDRWLREDLRPLFEETVFPASAPQATIFDMGEVRRLFEAHRSRRAKAGGILWAILVLSLWFQAYGTAHGTTGEEGNGA